MELKSNIELIDLLNGLSKAQAEELVKYIASLENEVRFLHAQIEQFCWSLRHAKFNCLRRTLVPQGEVHKVG